MPLVFCFATIIEVLGFSLLFKNKIFPTEQLNKIFPTEQLVVAMIGNFKNSDKSQAEMRELLSLWMPYLSEGFCGRCSALLKTRLQNLVSSGKINGISVSNGHDGNLADFCSMSLSMGSPEKSSPLPSNGHHINNAESSSRSPGLDFSMRHHASTCSPTTDSSNVAGKVSSRMVGGGPIDDLEVQKGFDLSREERERTRFSQIGRKKNFVHIEKINGKPINILKGLELHTEVFNSDEQKKIVDNIYKLQRMGQKGQLKERTYSEPRKWMRGKGRVTIQFGCCYNYAVDKNGNPPGIIRDEEVDPIPPMFKTIIKRLVRWHVLPPTVVPNSCIVNIYEEGDCIPPHIDHHDFVRPFCTLSFLTESNILFGSNLRTVGPGEFAGPVAIPLPVGSVLILSGNGADVAKHCVPGVHGKRISITFRKMDDSKLPYKFLPDPDLQGLQPFAPNKSPSSQVQTPHIRRNNPELHNVVEGVAELTGSPFKLGQNDFPPLGAGANSVNRPSKSKLDLASKPIESGYFEQVRYRE